MGRAKRAKPNKTPSKRSLKSLKTNNLNRNPACQKPNASAPLPTPTIPFEPTDHILLVGEGDFSFSQSLLFTHGCTSLLATSFDSSSAIEEKYPQAALNIAALRDEEGCKVLCDVDGTKLGKPGPGGGGRDVRKGGFDRVIFNFPHVGGLTKDVNRQVRHNQELLVGFFKAAMSLLAASGSIIVTIFEGEPYDLWNIRDLARHVGLGVGRSFKFQSSAYPGYKHSRTIGNIQGGGGWKGEDRSARTYIFEISDRIASAARSKKRKNNDIDTESD